MDPKEAALRKKATLPRRQWSEEQVLALRANLKPVPQRPPRMAEGEPPALR